MANVSPKLAVSSVYPKNPEKADLPLALEIDADNWGKLERTLERDIPEDMRCEIIKLANSYLEWRRFESAAQPASDLEDVLRLAGKAALSFRSLATGQVFPSSDAGIELKRQLKKCLADTPIRLNPVNIMILDQTTDKWEPMFSDETGLPTAIVVSFDLLGQISNELTFAVRQIKQEIGRQGIGGFTPGTSGSTFRAWLTNMDLLFKAKNKEIGARKEKFPFAATRIVERDDRNRSQILQAATYAIFLFELNKLFPEGFCEKVDTAIAMAYRVKKHRAEGKKVGHPSYRRKRVQESD